MTIYVTNSVDNTKLPCYTLYVLENTTTATFQKNYFGSITVSCIHESYDPYGSSNLFTSRKAVLSIRKCDKGEFFLPLGCLSGHDGFCRFVQSVQCTIRMDRIFGDPGLASRFQVRAGEPLRTFFVTFC